MLIYNKIFAQTVSTEYCLRPSWRTSVTIRVQVQVYFDVIKSNARARMSVNKV